MLRFELPETARVGPRVHDVAGREMARVVSGEWAAGKHSIRWCARDAEGRALEPGVCFCRLRATSLTGRTFEQGCPLTILR